MMSGALTIWKYDVEVTDQVQIEMPEGAQFLTVETQRGTPCAWFRVDPTAPKETRSFRLAGTGHPIGDEKYLGTFQMHNGGLVFHLFDAGEAATYIAMDHG